MQLLGQNIKEINQEFVISPIKSNQQVIVTQHNKIPLIFAAHYKHLCTSHILYCEFIKNTWKQQVCQKGMIPLNKQQNNFSEVMAGTSSVHKLLAPLQLILQDA